MRNLGIRRPILLCKKSVDVIYVKCQNIPVFPTVILSIKCPSAAINLESLYFLENYNGSVEVLFISSVFRLSVRRRQIKTYGERNFGETFCSRCCGGDFPESPRKLISRVPYTYSENFGAAGRHNSNSRTKLLPRNCFREPPQKTRKLDSEAGRLLKSPKQFPGNLLLSPSWILSRYFIFYCVTI